MLIQGKTGNLLTNQQSDGTQLDLPLGIFGSVMVNTQFGKYHELAARGSLYIGATALAGTIIPVNASNLVSTFTLWNPLGSGVNVALISYDAGLITATAVIGSLALVYQASVGSAILAPTSQTALTPVNALVGSGRAPAARLLSAGTLTGTPSVLATLGVSFGTTTASAGPVTIHKEFDGTLIIPPGVLITTVSTAAQTAAMQQQFVWAELNQ